MGRTVRTIVFGDVHGCLEELDELVKLVSFDPGDRLISLGDLLDRGPDPVGCVRRVRELGAEAVLSNHEEKALRWRRYERLEKTNPMKPPPEDRIKQWRALSDEDLSWIASLPPFLDLGLGWVAVHAGFEPAFPLWDQKVGHMIRVRYVDRNGEMVPFDEGSLDQPDGTVFWTEQWNRASVVYGHAIHSKESSRIDVFSGGACVGIDTGCVYGGRLSALLLCEGSECHMQMVQVQARREYVRIPT